MEKLASMPTYLVLLFQNDFLFRNGSAVKTETEQLPAEYANSSLAQQKQATKTKSAEELKEEEDIALALAISQSEAEAKELEKKRYVVDHSHLAQVKKETVIEDEENEEPELARYLNRNLWEQRQGQMDRAKSPDRFRSSPPSAPETPTHQMVRILGFYCLSQFKKKN